MQTRRVADRVVTEIRVLVCLFAVASAGCDDADVRVDGHEDRSGSPGVPDEIGSETGVRHFVVALDAPTILRHVPCSLDVASCSEVEGRRVAVTEIVEDASLSVHPDAVAPLDACLSQFRDPNLSARRREYALGVAARFHSEVDMSDYRILNVVNSVLDADAGRRSCTYALIQSETTQHGRLAFRCVGAPREPARP